MINQLLFDLGREYGEALGDFLDEAAENDSAVGEALCLARENL